MTEDNRTPRARMLRSRFTIALVVGALSIMVAAGAVAQMGKSALIGKLEGPEVVTDPAKQPKQLKEAPQLAEMVKAGKLPPVAERVGQDPLVIKPLHEIGKYGGTPISGTATGAARGPTICCSGTTRATKSRPTSPRATRCRTAGAPSSFTCAAG